MVRRRHRRELRTLGLGEAVATAILAGIIAQIVVQPPGALASVPDWLRYGAVAAGFVVFMLARKSIFAGVIAGEVVMIAGKYWLG
ncbi:branched-subunit amino acid transport protein [Bradyrhizobium sp. USDA 4503]